MDPKIEQTLIRAFERLGPAAVRRGLTATNHSWSNCFLATAVGVNLIGADISDITGLPEASWLPVMASFDSHEIEFRALAARWLHTQTQTRAV